MCVAECYGVWLTCLKPNHWYQLPHRHHHCAFWILISSRLVWSISFLLSRCQLHVCCDAALSIYLLCFAVWWSHSPKTWLICSFFFVSVETGSVSSSFHVIEGHPTYETDRTLAVLFWHIFRVLVQRVVLGTCCSSPALREDKSDHSHSTPGEWLLSSVLKAMRIENQGGRSGMFQFEGPD